MVANFRTEDAQRRLLTAVIAAHPELKLNFKAIAQHFGPEDWGKDGIEHFFRPLKKDALAVRDLVKAGQRAKDFFDNKAGKGGAAGSGAGAGNSAPATPKNRKRAAASAPSTGRSTASKKARASASTKPAPAPVPAAANVITVDDDDDDEENEFPPLPLDTPTQGPRFTDYGAKQFWGGDAQAQAQAQPQAPALDATQAETPTEEEDFKPHTPSDAAAYSFSQPQPSSAGVGAGAYNLDAYPISQPSFVADAGYHKGQGGFAVDDWVDDEV
ncbi:hypothetical protein KVR01_011454 [Diaporthe batatas]|uniref:uncharacterized protein n=1 Tax=Diaporthe batatas TaxID=748121 RepID=UPI001D0502D6|nr:uncharacterized protein KVR01_011454 [Diaporthe batatas]KAG8159011.1 hypothetical protein KVR01_011454 [Diaporthe batatas]